MRLKRLIADCIPDRLYLRIQYYYHFRKWLNLHRPKTFNEKLQWIKLYDHNPVYTTMVDKVKVKDYVSSIVGAEHIVSTLGVWDSADKIDFNALPNQFVIKCNHDSHGVIVVKDKSLVDENEIRKRLGKRLASSGFSYGRECPYKNVERKIIAEEFISDGHEDLIDYKVHCFNGQPKFILVCRDRFSKSGLKEDFFDISWNLIDVKRPGIPHGEILERPAELEKMLELAEKLSRGVPFLRTDFYCVNGKVLFGELTLFPASGFQKFEPEKCDREFGDWINLSDKR